VGWLSGLRRQFRKLLFNLIGSWVQIPPPPPGAGRVPPPPHLKNHTNMFKKKRKEDELPENIEDLLKEFKKLKEENKKLKEEIEEIKERQKFFIQNVKMERFNPFSEEGGNQSFTLSLLDENNSGVVITSLYTKEGSRVYGKPITEGKSEYPLSKEEEKIIKTVENEKRR
jgi:hypothetical protein